MICTHVNAKSTIQSKAKGLPVLTTMSKLYTHSRCMGATLQGASSQPGTAGSQNKKTYSIISQNMKNIQKYQNISKH